jgi:hypothetical protein
MMESAGSAQKVAAILILLVSLAASVVLAVRWHSLSSEVQAASERLAESRDRAAVATLDSASLPPNRILSVCNNSPEEITVSAVTAFYWDGHGQLKNFNSAKNQWHTWRIGAGTTQALSLTQQNAATVWDGSVIYYAMELNRQGKDMLLSGTSDDLRNGCISAVSGQGGR